MSIFKYAGFRSGESRSIKTDPEVASTRYHYLRSAAKMEMNRNLVAKYLDILLISGQVEMQVIGAAKVYFLSHRVPISSLLEFSSDMVIILDSALTIMQVNEPLLVQINEREKHWLGGISET